MKWILIALIKAYRATISPMLGDVCKYYPTCSAYGLEAIHTHGAVKGTLLTGARVLRCNPFSHGGVNPVPPRGQWRASVNPDGTPRLNGALQEVSAS